MYLAAWTGVANDSRNHVRLFATHSLYLNRLGLGHGALLWHGALCCMLEHYTPRVSVDTRLVLGFVLVLSCVYVACVHRVGRVTRCGASTEECSSSLYSESWGETD